jgi:outer membrane biosynthesis protein TonB
MAEVVAMQPKAKKSITLGRIIGNNVVTATIALDMVQLSELYNKASTNQQNELLEAVSPEIKSAIKSDNWTKAQSLAQQEIDTQLNDAVQATTITKAELKQSQEAQPKPQPKPQVKPETKPQVKPETKPQVKPETKPQVKPETKPQVKPETKPQVKPETKPQVKPKPQPKPETNAEDGGGNGRGSENGKDKSFPQKVRPANKSKKIKELTAEERKGAISWKQGTFWITIYPPYSQENVIHTKTRPQGTTIHKGKGSAKATVTTRGGKVDPLATIKMGIMNVEVLKGKDLIFSRREKKAPLLSGSYGRGRLLPGTVRRY